MTLCSSSTARYGSSDERHKRRLRRERAARPGRPGRGRRSADRPTGQDRARASADREHRPRARRSTSTSWASTSSTRRAMSPGGARPATCCSCPPAVTTITSASTPGSRRMGLSNPTASPDCTTSRSTSRRANGSRRPSADSSTRAIPLRQLTDHGTHLAVYLSDPDGNDLELAWDRPFEEWRRYGSDDATAATRAFDLDALLSNRR